MANETRTIYTYTHTHWDREWYQPFESFRAQLVSLVRFLLPKLSDGSMPRFYLDGQAIILEDVTAIEPSLAPQIKQLMADGRLTAGPWYVLPDEMLVGGESLIRNLAMGLEVTRQYGEPAMVGYCPDTFGHSQDLPSILNGFGITNAILWRGVPLLEMGPVFWWNSPDGSRVLAYHLTLGYTRTFFHELVQSKSSEEAVNKLLHDLKGWVGLASGTNGGASPYNKAIAGALLPMGGDHVAPPGDLQMLVDQVNEKAKREKLPMQVVPTTLAEFMRMVEGKVKGSMKIVQGIDGELRFNRAASFYERGYLLYGVLSTRLYLKRANRLSEYRLGRLLEPVRAIADLALNSTSSRGEFDYAWKLLLKNHPHDSICGCSVDAVHDEMMTRTAKLNELIDSMLDRVAADVSKHDFATGMSHLDPALKQDRLTVMNASATTLSGPVYMHWFEPVNSKRWAKPNSNVQIVRQERADQLFAGWGTVPYYKDVDVYEGWVLAEDVPAFGYRSLAWPRQAEASAHPPVTVGQNKLSNGHLSLTISASGRITVSHSVHGTPDKTYKLSHIIRDVGDCGDSYNFDPIPGDKPIEAKLVGIRQGLKGPLMGSLILSYEIDIPEANVPDSNILKRNDPEASKIELVKRSRNKIRHEIEVEISLERGIPIVYFDATWENKSRDHRMEVLIDTGAPINTSYSENHLSVVRRYHNLRLKDKLPVAAGHEAVPDRYPAQRFVVANGQVFINTGMPEYGVDGSKLSLTMLRAMSYLSKPRLWTRGGGAGPNVQTPGANCLGKNECSYAWAPLAVPFTDIQPMGGGDDWLQEAYRLTEVYEGPLWGALGTGRLNDDSKGVDSRSFLHISNLNIRGVAFYESSPGTFTVRLLNVTNEEQVGRIRLNTKPLTAELVNLAGDVQETLKMESDETGYTGEVRFGPYQTRTLRLGRVL
jgi:mannosylglycerate hydrolase